jgi:hypothetical protein
MHCLFKVDFCTIMALVNARNAVSFITQINLNAKKSGAIKLLAPTMRNLTLDFQFSHTIVLKVQLRNATRSKIRIIGHTILFRPPVPPLLKKLLSLCVVGNSIGRIFLIKPTLDRQHGILNSPRARSCGTRTRNLTETIN